MQSISNAEISDMLLFVEERINLIVERCRCIESAFKVSAKIAPTNVKESHPSVQI